MTRALPEAEAGERHNAMVGMASDTVLQLTTLPKLMLTMLESGDWRRLIRPIDHREFTNQTIADWILGEPWPGLHFPDWATLYAILDKNIDVGAKCITQLQRAGAPDREQAEVVFRVKAANNGLVSKSSRPGRPKKSDERHFLPKGENPSRLVARLKRDHRDVFVALERGEYQTVRAAARAAGIVKTKTPLEQLEHWWKKATTDERQTFLRFLRETPVDWR